MPLRRSVLVPLLFVLVVAGCSPSDSDDTSSPSVASSPPLVVISIDGMRWDYLNMHEAPTLSRLAREGTHVEHLIPVFPTKTFPNHYSIVTGLHPSHHGIIANNMYDPKMDATFGLDDTEAITNANWWGGEPIWVTAETQGRTTATYFWPGSEAPIQGVRPTEWREYDGSVPGTTRVDEVLSWLDRPSETRPDLLTLYFSRVDTKGHFHGPASDSVAVALKEVDGFIQRLLDGLEARGMADAVNLVVTSDHGMTPTSRDRTIVLDHYIDLDDIRLIDMNPVAMMEPDEDASTDAIVSALDEVPHLSAYRKGTLPDTLHFDGHRRIPSVLALADEGWTIATQTWLDNNPEWDGGGAHGYDPRYENMHALLAARGPGFRDSTRVDRLSLIHLYEMMTAVLDVEPAANDGRLEATRSLLTPTASAPREAP